MTANAGYHAYATGDVLTAAQVQYNLQNQTVMYFATTTARDTALSGKLVDGMCAYTPATGVLVYVSATSTWTSLGSTLPSQTGNAGKYLTTDGSATSWGTVASGSMTQIATGTFSGATTTISSIPQSYKSLYLTFTSVSNSDAAGYYLLLRYNSETASTYLWSNVANGGASSASGEPGIRIGQQSFLPDNQNNGTITMPLYSVSGLRKLSIYNSVRYDGSIVTSGTGSTTGVTAAITSINFTTSFTFSGGTYILYGVN